MILLDTHVVAWLVADPSRLSVRAASAIRRARSNQGVAIATISIWELALMFAHGRLRAPGNVEASVRWVVEGSGATLKPITPEIAVLSQSDAFSHGDPADRLIAATALLHRAPLVTSDSRLRKVKEITTVW